MLLFHFSSADYFSMLHQLKLRLNEEMTRRSFLGWAISGLQIRSSKGKNLYVYVPFPSIMPPEWSITY